MVQVGLECMVMLGEEHSREFARRGQFFDLLILHLRLFIERSLSFQSPKILSMVMGALGQADRGNSLGLRVLAAFDMLCVIDGGKPVSSLIGLLQPSGRLAKSGVLLSAGLNCLGHVLRVRPECMARGLPTILEWFDLVGRWEPLSSSMRRNIEHGLKCQLTVLYPGLEGTPFHSMVGEALSRAKQQSRVKRELPPILDEPEEKYTKRMKPSAAFAQESDQLRVDALKVPFPQVTTILMKALRKIEPSSLGVRLEAWRPTATAEAAPPAFEDPRKRTTRSELRAFKDEPATFEYEQYQRLLTGNLGRILDGGQRLGLEMSRFGQGRRKDWAQLVARLVVSLQDPLVEARLVDYCVQDLAVRSGLLLIWLRFKWITDADEYEQAFVRLLSRMESLIELDSTSVDLEEALGDLLVFSPGAGLESAICMFFMRAFGLADAPEPEEGEDPEHDPVKQALIFRLLARVLTERPAYRHALGSLVEELVRSPEPALRTDTFKLCGQTLKLEPLGQLYTELAIKRLVGDDEDSLGLYLELLGKDLGLLALLSPIYSTLSEERIAELSNKLPALLQHAYEHSPESLDSLASTITASEGPVVSLVVAAFPSPIPIPLPVIDAIFESGNAEAVAGLAMKNVDRQTITRALPVLINHLLADPSSTDGKSLLTSLFLHFVNGPAALPPQDLFRYLHEQESQLTLRRCIEACNICFANPTIWKPEVLLAAFEAILASSESASALPTTYMRSVLQALTLYPKVVAAGVQTLLTRLITLRVWEAPRLWEGWLRAARSLLPSSVPLLLQLPLEHAKLAIEALPEARAPLKEYLWQQPPSLRNRYSQILSLVE